jgi:hypothetical protein
MEPEGSLLCLQEHWSLFLPWSVQSIPPPYLSKIYFKYYPPVYVCVFLVVLFLLAFPQKSYMHATCISCLILPDLIIDSMLNTRYVASLLCDITAVAEICWLHRCLAVTVSCLSCKNMLKILWRLSLNCAACKWWFVGLSYCVPFELTGIFFIRLLTQDVVYPGSLSGRTSSWTIYH